MNLRKTPYLILFVVLMSMGIGTASALVTITLAGDVNIEGVLGIGINDAGNNDVIKFDDGSETLQWDESKNRFSLSNELAIDGPIQVGAISATPVTYHRFGTTTESVHGLLGVTDVFIQDDLEVGDTALIDGWLYVGTDTDSDTDVICMDDSSCSESLKWNTNLGRFEFSERLLVSANVLYVGTVDGFDDYFICMDGPGCTKAIQWDDGRGFFRITDTVFTEKTFQAMPLAAAPVCSTANDFGKLYVDNSDAFCYCSGSAWIKIVGAGTCS